MIKQETGCPEDIVELIQQHRLEMLKHSPEESVHALDQETLQDTSVTFFSYREGKELAACGAIKQFANNAAELKSMKTKDGFLRRGIAQLLLAHIEKYAIEQGLEALYLETGSAEAFYPAVAMYKKNGFTECGPFADYQSDPHSLFFKKCI